MELPRQVRSCLALFTHDRCWILPAASSGDGRRQSAHPRDTPRLWRFWSGSRRAVRRLQSWVAMSDPSLPIPPNPSSTQEPCEHVAVLGRDSRAHLYRGVSSPHPIGVVVEAEREEVLGTIRRLSLVTPWGEAITGAGVVHWISPINNKEYRVGLRFVNPSQAFSRAISRITEQFPTRLFDEPQAPRSTGDLEAQDCPSTRRCPAPNAAEADPHEGPPTRRYTAPIEAAEIAADPWFPWGLQVCAR